MEPRNSHGRRRVLAWLGGVAALASGCGGEPATDHCPDGGPMLRVGDVPVGAHVRPAASAYILARDAGGFYAYSNECTHEGCTVPCPDATGVSRCPCHGAEFDANGDNTRPAGGVRRQGNLRHFRVGFDGTGDDARVVVDVAVVEADRTVRAAPPA